MELLNVAAPKKPAVSLAQGAARAGLHGTRTMPGMSARGATKDKRPDSNQAPPRREALPSDAMNKERFDFLTHEQFERLSQNEKIAYLDRATFELARLRKAHIGAPGGPEPDLPATPKKSRD